MRELAQRRPIFHSEADFQHALAWEIHALHTDCQIRLERPVKGIDPSRRRPRVDLWVWVAIVVFAARDDADLRRQHLHEARWAANPDEPAGVKRWADEMIDRLRADRDAALEREAEGHF